MAEQYFISAETGPVVDAIDLVGTGVFSPEMDALIVEMTERVKEWPLNRYVQVVKPPMDSPTTQPPDTLS